jgi:ribosomal protein S12 methylthiotransferase accessory factor
MIACDGSVCSNENEHLLNSLIARFAEFGITRLAATTWLDRIGIPTYSCVCPGTTDVISVYNGKGVDNAASSISAIMECVERTTALWDLKRVVFASEANLLRTNMVLGPGEFTEPLRADYSPEQVSPWIPAQLMGHSELCYVPADLAFSGYRPLGIPASPFRMVTSNGLGAGFSAERALTHALYEVIERDVVSCVELQASFHAAGVLEYIADAFGIDRRLVASEFVDNPNVATSVELTSLPDDISRLVCQFEQAGVRFHLKQLPSSFDIPVFGACAVEDMGAGGVLAAAGFAAHADPGTACRSAILEIAQSRATSLQGAREDYHAHPLKSRVDGLPKSDWLLTPSDKKIAYTATSGEEKSQPNRGSFEWLCARVRSVGLRRIAVVDFARYPGIYAYRVLVPGVETVHATGGLSRMGHRGKAFIHVGGASK